MPMDQIFDSEDLELDPKSQVLQQQKNHDKATKKLTEIKQEEDQDDTMNDSFKSEDNAANTSYIDNPYLAATKLPANQGMDVSWHSKSTKKTPNNVKYVNLSVTE